MKFIQSKAGAIESADPSSWSSYEILIDRMWLAVPFLRQSLS